MRTYTLFDAPTIYLQAAFPYSFLDGSEALSEFESVVCTLTLGVVCKISVDWLCGSSDGRYSITSSSRCLSLGTPCCLATRP